MSDRRLLLTRTVKLSVLLGLGFAGYPFVASLLPDAQPDDQRRQRWEREIDLTGLQPGQFLNIDDWPGGPVAIYRRSSYERDGLQRIGAQLQDPESAHSRQPAALRTPTRSHLAEYFVFIPVDTERGCQIRYLPPDKLPRPGLAWYGGFSEPCNGSLYDTAGRVYRDQRGARQQNLSVPAYEAPGERTLRLLGPPGP